MGNGEGSKRESCDGLSDQMCNLLRDGDKAVTLELFVFDALTTRVKSLAPVEDGAPVLAQHNHLMTASEDLFIHFGLYFVHAYRPVFRL